MLRRYQASTHTLLLFDKRACLAQTGGYFQAAGIFGIGNGYREQASLRHFLRRDQNLRFFFHQQIQRIYTPA